MISGNRKQEKLIQEKIFSTIFMLRRIITNTRLYSINHEKVRTMIGKAYISLNEILKITNELNLLIIDKDLIINNKAIRAEEAEHFTLFITILKQKGIGHVSFKKGISVKELVQFLTDLSSPLTKKVYSGPGINCGKLQLKGKSQGGTSSSQSVFAGQAQGRLQKGSQELLAKLQALSNEQMTLAQELYFTIKEKKECDIDGVRGAISSFVTLISQNTNPLSMLTNLKSNDEYTFTHVINVCILTLAQAESLGFTGQHLYDIGISAALHDIGKIFIPEEILSKPAKLDKKEREIIETHSIKGAGHIISLSNVPKLAVLAALEHHIRYDGSGYPNIGKNWKPNIVSQMISISDTFDAMRSSRPYNDGRPEQIIVDVLQKGKGKAFNPMLVDNFLKILARRQSPPS